MHVQDSFTSVFDYLITSVFLVHFLIQNSPCILTLVICNLFGLKVTSL